MPPNWSTIAQLRAELRGWTMATRNDRPLGVEFAAKFGPPPKKNKRRKKENFTKKLASGVEGGSVTLHFGRRSVGSPFFPFFFFFLFFGRWSFSRSAVVARPFFCCALEAAPLLLWLLTLLLLSWSLACLLCRRRRLRRKRDCVAVACSSSTAIAASTNITFCLSSCSSIWCTFSLIRSFFLILLFLLRM